MDEVGKALELSNPRGATMCINILLRSIAGYTVLYHQLAGISRIGKLEQERSPTKLSPIDHPPLFRSFHQAGLGASRVDAPRVKRALGRPTVPVVPVNIAQTTLNGAHVACRAATEPKS
jgi:hypothetical protein